MNNELSAFDQVESLIREAVEKDDISIALAQIDRMNRAKELVGKVLAKTIYMLYTNWFNFSASKSDKFLDVMNSINVDPHTVARYLKVWQYHDSLPAFMQDKPIRETIPVTNALSQGYEISEENWEKLEKASNLSEIQRIITKDVKGKEPRAGSLQIYLDSDGTYYGWKDGERHNAGWLDVDNNDSVVQEIIERTIKNVGVQRK